MDLNEIQVKAKLTSELTVINIKALIQHLNPPAGMFEDITEGFEFLYTLKIWEGHDSYKFDQALTSIKRQDLIPLARKLPWLSTEKPVPKDPFSQMKLSMRSLVNILKTEIQKNEWLSMDIDSKLQFKAKISLLIRDGVFSTDLNNLIVWMRILKREDLVKRITEHKFLFMNMSEYQFIKKLRKEVDAQAKDLLTWENSLREFITTQNKKVKQALDDEYLVDLESVYVPLTIIKKKPKVISVVMKQLIMRLHSSEKSQKSK